jgi:hypothetical protein
MLPVEVEVKEEEDMGADEGGGVVSRPCFK